jgi:DNA-binding response OmpR family regulator
MGIHSNPRREWRQAWELLQKPDAPRIAILDWLLPHLTGPEVCRRVRETHREPYTYIFLLTSKHTKDETVEGLEAGADDYIVKPFDRHELLMRLRVGVRIIGAMSHSTPILQPVEFYSSFISHASDDAEISDKLALISSSAE